MAAEEIKFGVDESEAFADHSHDGASSFNTDSGDEDDTDDLLSEGVETPLNDAKLSEVEKDAGTEAEALSQDCQSVLRYCSKLSDFLAEVQRPEVDDAAVTAKASDLIAVLDTAFPAMLRVTSSLKSKLLALVADLDKLAMAIPDLPGHKKPDLATARFEGMMATTEKLEPLDKEATIAALKKLEPPDVEALSADLERLEFLITNLDANIGGGLEKLKVPVNTQIDGHEEMKSIISDINAKLMALENLKVNRGVKREEATEN